MLLQKFAAPTLASLLLGEHWQRTGVLITWMIPWHFFQFITLPVSMSLHITGNQKLAAALQVSGMGIRVGSVTLAVIYANEYISEVYAVSGFLFYALYLYAILKVLSDSGKPNSDEVKQ